ncbi:hypothetical protein ABH894_005270 [Paenibacillus sp. RC62]
MNIWNCFCIFYSENHYFPYSEFALFVEKYWETNKFHATIKIGKYNKIEHIYHNTSNGSYTRQMEVNID